MHIVSFGQIREYRKERSFDYKPSSLEVHFESNDLTFPSVTKFIKIAISEATMKVF